MTTQALTTLIGRIGLIAGLFILANLAMHGFDAWWSERDAYPYELEIK